MFYTMKYWIKWETTFVIFFSTLWCVSIDQSVSYTGRHFRTFTFNKVHGKICSKITGDAWQLFKYGFQSENGFKYELLPEHWPFKKTVYSREENKVNAGKFTHFFLIFIHSWPLNKQFPFTYFIPITTTPPQLHEA